MQLIAIVFAFVAMVGLVLADFHYADLAEPNEHGAMVSKKHVQMAQSCLMSCLQQFHAP